MRLSIIFIPLLSLVPCIIWLWYFSSRNLYKRPSSRILTGTFVLGGLATIPALFLNLFGQSMLIGIFGPGQMTHLLALLFVVGPVEEISKFAVVFLFPYRSSEFDEPLDGVVYSATAALGFAAIENFVYLAQNEPTLVLLRGPLSNPGHALFSALWGLSLSRARAAPNLFRERFPILATGILAASLLHSLFDILLVAATHLTIFFFVLLLIAMVGLFIFVRAQIIYHRETSPHRAGTIFLPTGRFCQECGARGASGTRCIKCGVFIPEPEEMQLCPACSTPQRPGAKFCARCATSLKLPARENLHTAPHFSTVTPEGEERIAFILNQNEVHVGRTLNNEFVIPHPSVSKRHARLVCGEVEDGQYLIYDLESSNGTFVNGRRVKEMPLVDGCEVRFGRVNFVYRAPGEAARGEAARREADAV